MFIPLTNDPGCSGSNCIMEVIAPVIGGTAACQPWVGACPGGAGTCPTLGSTCTDGTLTYENIGAYYPNDIGPTSASLVSGNVVATNLTEGGGGSTGNIFNGLTNKVWNDQSISWYLFQDDSGSINEESSSHEYAHRVDQGLSVGSSLAMNSAPVQNAINSISAPSSTAATLDMSKGNTQQLTCTGTVAGTVTLTTANLKPGETMTFIFVQHNTAGFGCTVGFPTNMHNATAVGNVLNEVSTQEFTVSNNGTDLYAKGSGQICTSSCGTP